MAEEDSKMETEEAPKKGGKGGKGDKGGKGGKGKKEEKKPEPTPEPVPEPAAEPAAEAAAEPAAEGEATAEGETKEEVVPLDPQSALKEVLRTSLFHDGLARGLHEAVKALDRREAHLCVLSSSCNEPAYSKLISALCKEHTIPLIKVEDSKVLGEWVGLCKYNSEGKAVKVVGCSCAVIKSWGEETAARQYIMDHIKNQ
jgi:small subunit ribosomal protein S12e